MVCRHKLVIYIIIYLFSIARMLLGRNSRGVFKPNTDSLPRVWLIRRDFSVLVKWNHIMLAVQIPWVLNWYNSAAMGIPFDLRQSLPFFWSICTALLLIFLRQILSVLCFFHNERKLSHNWIQVHTCSVLIPSLNLKFHQQVVGKSNRVSLFIIVLGWDHSTVMILTLLGK